MVTRHLDGYPLWPTSVANPHMPSEYRSTRDLVGDLTRAVRARGLRMGLYYAGGLDWTFINTPIRTMADFMRQQALGPEYARYAAAQWTELIDAYQPSILWNDVGWPAESNPHELFAHYYDGVVNDRWTKVSLPRNHLVRALYLRFISLALKSLARLGRPLPQQAPSFHLINVGPDGAGRIPEIQGQPLRQLGAWLDANGEAIYATRPWTRPAGTTTGGQQVRYTRKDRVVYAIVLSDRLTDSLTIRDLVLPAGSRIRMLDGSVDLPWTQAADGVRIATPQQPTNPHAQVLEIIASSRGRDRAARDDQPAGSDLSGGGEPRQSVPRP